MNKPPRDLETELFDLGEYEFEEYYGLHSLKGPSNVPEEFDHVVREKKLGEHVRKTGLANINGRVYEMRETVDPQKSLRRKFHLPNEEIPKTASRIDLGPLNFDPSDRDYSLVPNSDFGDGRVGNERVLEEKSKISARKEGGKVKIDGKDYFAYEFKGDQGRVEREIYPLDGLDGVGGVGYNNSAHEKTLELLANESETSPARESFGSIKGTAQTQFVDGEGLELGITGNEVYFLSSDILSPIEGKNNSHITDYTPFRFKGSNISYTQFGTFAELLIELSDADHLAKIEPCNSREAKVKLQEAAAIVYQAKQENRDLDNSERIEAEKRFTEYALSTGFFKALPNAVKDRVFTPQKSPNSSSLVDKLISAGIPEEAIERNERLWDYLTNVKENDVVSANQNFHVADRDGQRWLLKITDNEKKARMEAAANYYLGQHFNFVVPGKAPEPIEANGLYMTLQQEVPQTVERGIDYWIASFALFHKDAERIMDENKVIVPNKELRSVDHLEEMFNASKGNHELEFRKKEIRDAIDYLTETDYKIMGHGDAKRGNLFGSYLVDLEGCGRMYAGIDLAMVLMQSGVKKEDWDVHLRNYLEIKGTDGSFEKEFQDLREGTHYAAVYMATKEVCGSSLRRINTETKKDNEQLVYRSAA